MGNTFSKPTLNSEESSQINPKEINPSVYLQNMDGVEKLFNRFDANGDGKISVSEVIDFLTCHGFSSTDEGGEHRRILAELDSDNDGFLSLPEFATFCRSSTEDSGGSSEIGDAFCLYDQDQNGPISAVGLQHMLKRLVRMCSHEDCNSMIRSVDSDGDGNVVNFEEFEKMMTNTNKSKG